MFHFKNEKMTDLFQWSRDVIIVFDDLQYVGEEVHFSNDRTKSYTRAINKQGEVEIPNFLLTKAKPLEVYLYLKDENGEYTKTRRIVRVLARPRPADYVDPEEDSPTWETKLDIYQGEENAGKVLIVGEDGNITCQTLGELGGDRNFEFTQNSASDTWKITHNLTKYPSVTVIDSSGNVVLGEVKYNDLNSLTVTFSGAFSGKASLN